MNKANTRRAYIGVIRKRVEGLCSQEFRMLDVFKVMLSQGAVGVSALQQDMRPVGGTGVFEEEEGLLVC